jgi:hypothetical protein
VKPYGYKLKGGCDCIQCRNPNPKSKKADRHKAKIQIKKELKDLK